MTKERITEIRKRCEDAVEILGGVNAVLVDMFSMLDALEGTIEDRDRWMVRAKAMERPTLSAGHFCKMCAVSATADCGQCGGQI